MNTVEVTDYIVTLTSGVPIRLRNAFIAGNGIAGDLADGTTYRLADTEYVDVRPATAESGEFVDPLGRTPGDIIILARDIDIAAGPELYVAGTEFLVLEVLPPVRPFGPTRTSATYRVRAILPSRVLAEREHTLSAVLFQTN